MANFPDREVLDIQALSSFVRRKMDELKLSSYEVAARAEAGGPQYSIAHTTVWGAQAGRWKSVKPATIRALAYGLGVPEQTLLNLAYGRGEDGSGEVLEKREITLPDRVWQMLDVSAKKCGHDAAIHIEKMILYVIGGEDVSFDRKRVKALRKQDAFSFDKQPKSAQAQRRAS